MRHFFILATIWFLLFVSGFAVGYLIFGTNQLNEISKNGRETVGIVIKKEPENHQNLHYKYQVDGKDFNGIGRGGEGNPEFEEIKTGQTVIVTFDFNRPQNSYLGRLERYTETNYFLVFVMALGFSLFPAILISVIYILLLKFVFNR